MKPLTIVIVDDESLARQGLRHHLREIEGVEIIAEFGDSQRALNYLQTERPDLLLVDIEMPGMTGMVLVEKPLRLYRVRVDPTIHVFFEPPPDVFAQHVLGVLFLHLARPSKLDEMMVCEGAGVARV